MTIPLYLILLGACADQGVAPVREGPSLTLAEDSYDFGSVPQGTRVEHSFPVRNDGSEELLIASIEVPEVFDRKDFPSSLKPGETGEIAVGFDTTGLGGSGTFRIAITTNELARESHTVSLSGSIVPLIEIRPQNRVYFLDLLRGEGAEKELSILNHQDRPLMIEEVSAKPGGSFSANLETVRQGSEYRLKVTLDPSAPAGRFEETLELKTDSPELPRIPIYARASIVERVSAAPDAVRFSRVQLSELRKEAFGLKRVRVAKRDASDFQLLGAFTDVPFISVDLQPEVENRSYLIFLRIDAARATRGPLQGTLTVKTNDLEFPVLQIPISGDFH